MKITSVILLLLLTTTVVCAESNIGKYSHWLGRDKVLHFVDSSVLTVWNYGIYHDCFANSKKSSLVFSVSLTSIMGFGKEFSDKKFNKTGWSWYDITYNFAGIGFGIILINNLNIP